MLKVAVTVFYNTLDKQTAHFGSGDELQLSKTDKWLELVCINWYLVQKDCKLLLY